MPYVAYQDLALGRERLASIEQANQIIAAYQAQGFSLTLRQLYYQFVSRGLIANKDSEYKRLGAIISDGRLAGLVDWDAIVDRTRNLRALIHWKSPAEILQAAAASFRLDKWRSQPYRIEVWIEKDALVGVIEGVCADQDVPYFSCRGYTSQSEMWAASQRLLTYILAGQIPVILHLGDHDPSGKDMTRDIRDRLQLFTGQRIEVDRLALNMDQIQAFAPPPNPAKVTDSRAAAYIAAYGHESWELDALEPAVLADLIGTAISALRGEEAWQAEQAREEAARVALTEAAHAWGQKED